MSSGRESPNGSGELSPFSIRSSPTANIEDIKSIDEIIDELIEKGIIEDRSLRYDTDNEFFTYKDSSDTKYFVKVGKTKEKQGLVAHENEIYDAIDTFSEDEKAYFMKRTGKGDDEYAYCILEYVEGTPLYNYITALQSRKVKPPPREIYTILYDITKALNILLEHDIVHGDLKSQNIMVNPVKLFDFELSANFSSSALEKNMSPTHRNPSHGYLYICQVLDEYGRGELISHIRTICEADPLDTKLYTKCLDILERHLQTLSGGARKTKRRGKSKRRTKRNPIKKVRWSRKNVLCRFGKGA